MIRKLIPVVLALLGCALGGGAGYFLRPTAPPAEHTEQPKAADGEGATEAESDLLPDYVKLSNQFIIPLLEKGQVNAMVILSLSLEVETGTSEEVYSREPKLRDAFLQVLFDHANAGGFRGDFTEGTNLDALRQALREAALRTLGEIVTDVLISDIVRQDS